MSSPPPPGEYHWGDPAGPLPPPQPRFSGGMIVAGVLLGAFLAVVATIVSGLAAAWVSAGGLEEGFGPLSVLVFVLLLMVLPGLSGLAAFRGRTPAGRGLGLGILIGSSLVSIVFGGVCINLMTSGL